VSPTLPLTELVVASLLLEGKVVAGAGQISQSRKKQGCVDEHGSASQWPAGCVAITSQERSAVFAKNPALQGGKCGMAAA
jgi:hypothetical protein